MASSMTNGPPSIAEENDQDHTISSSSINFGSSETLDQVLNLTDVGAMTRLLHECTAYQRNFDLQLETLLSQRTDLEKHLSNLQKSALVLEIVKADADHLRPRRPGQRQGQGARPRPVQRPFDPR
ncbi:hypothetical protein Scep_006418 [Stephania cephalantha]|uniref:Uncharacterized protein n=1 Tax=Stephania cephalantha TaxID=152367 RepID=A0AAP0K811_9MAGN